MKDVQKEGSSTTSLKHLASGLVLVYVAAVVLFYFLAGEQLHLRQSRGNLPMPGAESGTVELAQGAVIEQTFTAEIQRLQTVSVQWGTYYRPNAGTVTMELWNGGTGRLLLSQKYDAAAIEEGGVITLAAEATLEGLCGVPLLLRIYADSQPGSAASPLMNQSTPAAEGFALFLNGIPTAGTLCFAASGQDYIWTGLHYWQFAATGLALIVLLIAVVWHRFRTRKHSYIVNAVIAVNKYRFLIRQLVSRDFKTKYKRSILGVFWSFLNPLMTMMVQYFVFSTIFKNDIPYFAAYLIIGTVMFNFFSEACGMTLTSILGNASLITKVYVPKYIYPLTRTLSSAVNLLISLLPALIVCLATGVRLQKSVILSLYFFVCVIVFSLGLGMLLATSMVFFRDTQFLWGVLNMMWMYATPVFYPETILPDNLKFVLQINPLHHFLKSIRMCILDGLSPEPAVYFQCLMIALGMLLLGAFVFYREQNKFVLYL